MKQINSETYLASTEGELSQVLQDACQAFPGSNFSASGKALHYEGEGVLFDLVVRNFLVNKGLLVQVV